MRFLLNSQLAPAPPQACSALSTRGTDAPNGCVTRSSRCDIDLQAFVARRFLLIITFHFVSGKFSKRIFDMLSETGGNKVNLATIIYAAAFAIGLVTR